MNEQPDDVRLQTLLREERDKEPLPPRFQDNVWQRIAAAERRAAASHSFSLANWLNGLFARPAAAVAWVALLLVVGMGAGYAWAGHDTTQWDQQLSTYYAASINPYLKQSQ